MASAALGKAVMEADAAVAQVSREKARWKINFHLVQDFYGDY